ncbi:MAG: M24 family metallopeptidase [Alcaligenaceae bacterium]|nr:M24 family metallopeptidase [Alcaligenaceae bacterium SAGV5]MPS54778.1 M24 family metallopeptidase [Alcaligenaceae bacterium SAGV3]MPT56919.1 M24 family metallopeptidase [Alcaligenaceae bacterium]
MSIPAQDLTPFAARRRRVLDIMRARGGGIAILPTSRELVRNRDAEFPFRFDSDFFYLTGFPEPEAWLVLIAGAEDRSILFCRGKNLEREIWDGYRIGPDAAAGQFGFDRALPVEALADELPKLIADQPALFVPMGSDRLFDTHLRGWLDRVRAMGRSGATAPAGSYDLRAILAEMRLVKDAFEIETMRRAGAISADAHVRAMRASRPGLREYEIEAELLHEFRRHGSQSVAYNSIVATGHNACVLHYRAGDAELKDGDLMLIDAGCELDGYASDITRTFPVNGRFSGPQRALYDLVQEAQNAAAALTRPGARWNEGHDAAVRVLAQGMIDEGLLTGTLDGVLESQQYARFYMHRTGHWLGMDVHDVGDYREPGAAQSADEPRPWRTLRPGMVLTIEPGIYVRPAADVPERFWDIGIRIEDDAVVTESGCELISRGVPVAADEIEAIMRG